MPTEAGQVFFLCRDRTKQVLPRLTPRQTVLYGNLLRRQMQWFIRKLSLIHHGMQNPQIYSRSITSFLFPHVRERGSGIVEIRFGPVRLVAGPELPALGYIEQGSSSLAHEEPSRCQQKAGHKGDRRSGSRCSTERKLVFRQGAETGRETGVSTGRRRTKDRSAPSECEPFHFEVVDDQT